MENQNLIHGLAHKGGDKMINVQIFKIALLFALFFTSSGIYGLDVMASESRFKSRGLDIPVVFEDESFPEYQKQMVMEDYQSVLGDLQPQGRYGVRKKASFSRDDKNYSVNEAIHFQGRKKWPDGYENLFGVVAKSDDGSESLIIPKELSDGYRSVYELEKSHESAFSELADFVDLMNNIDTAELESIFDVMYLPGEMQKYHDEVESKEISQFRDAYKGYNYFKSSVLNYHMESIDGTEKLVTEIIMEDKTGDHRKRNVPVVYDNDKWKLLVITPGT